MSDLTLLFTIIIYSCILIIIIGVIYLTFDFLHKRIRIWISNKRSKPWYSSIVPDLLLKSIGSDEKILYKSTKIKHRKKLRIVQVIAYFCFLGFFLVIFILISFAFSELFPLMIIFALLFPLIVIRSFSREFKKNSFFIFTDRQVHYYLYQYKTKSGNVVSYQYSKLMGVTYKKRFYDKRGDYGTIQFITTDLIPSRLTINNVYNFHFHRKLVDSILYHFGSLHNRWSQLSNEKNFQFPIIYNTSEQKIRKNIKSVRNYIIACLITIIISFFIYIIIDVVYIDELWKFYLAFGTIIIFDIIILTILLRIVFQTTFRTANKNTIMSIMKNEITVTYKTKIKNIQLNQNISLDFGKSNNPMNPPKDNEELDYINVYNLYDKNEKIIFGPIVQLRNLLLFLFSYIIVLKSNLNYLFSKNELLSLYSKFPSEIASEIKKEQLTKQYELNRIKLKVTQTIPNHQIDYYQYVKANLEPDEYVISKASTVVELKNQIIKLIIGLCCFFITFYFGSFLFYPFFPTIYFPINPLFIFILPIITFIGTTILCCISPMVIAGYRKLKNVSYLLTNKKVIWVDPTLIIPIPINLILSVHQTVNRDKNYNIQIILKKPIYKLPGILKSQLSITNLHYENDFYLLLVYLKNTQEAISKEESMKRSTESHLDQSLLDREQHDIMLKDFKRNILPYLMIGLFSSFTFIFTFALKISWLGFIFPIIGIILFIYAKRKYKDEDPEEKTQIKENIKSITKKYCTNCGKLLNGDMNFCPYCNFRQD